MLGKNTSINSSHNGDLVTSMSTKLLVNNISVRMVLNSGAARIFFKGAKVFGNNTAQVQWKNPKDLVIIRL